MKTSNQSIVSKRRVAWFNSRLAVIAGTGILALGTACFVAPAHAGPQVSKQEGQILQDVVEIIQNAQVAELDQLAADFHGALSYGGNATAMTNLWVKNSSLIFNGGTPYVGRDAVMSFFTTGSYFHNNWVSLAPEYKTVITVHGDTATISTQCVAVDLTVSPMVVKSVIQVNATAVRREGKWLFTSMNNTTPAPL